MSKILELASALTSNPLRSLVRMQRAQRSHENLLKNHGRMLDQSLLEDTKLVCDRIEMLRRFPKGGVVAEVGVAAGDLSAKILEICKPDTLHLIDPWSDEATPDCSPQAHGRVGCYRNVLVRFEKEIASGQVKVHRSLSTEVLPSFADNYLDWIYLDAAHDYQSVADELKIAVRIVKESGLISGHDYIRWAGPTARYGVMEAVNEFAEKTDSPFVFLTNQFDKHESFALKLRKPGKN